MNELATRPRNHVAPHDLQEVTAEPGSNTYGRAVTIGLALLFAVGIGVLGGPEPHATAASGGGTAKPGRARVFVGSPAARRARTIRRVFGKRYGAQAVRVARCESGLRPWARNGQFQGLFQMGKAERSRYGHGRGAYRQALAARRYFTASGKDWSPWSCKP